MAYEVKPWGRNKGCILVLRTSDISSRETFSREINEEHGEGGGLNANYPTLEAVAIVANALGAVNGFRYNKQFMFKTAGLDEIILEFNEPENKRAAEATIQEALKGGEFPIDIASKDKTENPAVKCLLCGGEMKLEVYESTSYWQCQKDPTHRMSLSEWSDIRGGDNKERVMAAMKERQTNLQAQVAEA